MSVDKVFERFSNNLIFIDKLVFFWYFLFRTTKWRVNANPDRSQFVVRADNGPHLDF